MSVMENEILTPQVMYELNVPAGIMDVSSRIRISICLSRVTANVIPDPVVICNTCLDDEPRGQSNRALTIELVSNLPGNSAASWSYVDPNDTVYIFHAVRTCGLLTGYVHYQTCGKLWRFTNTSHNPTSLPLVPYVRGNGDDPNDATGGNMRLGQSDSPLYAWDVPAFASGSGGTNFFDPVQQKYYWINVNARYFAKNANNLYVLSDDIYKYVLADQTSNSPVTPINYRAVNVSADVFDSVSATEHFVYAHYHNGTQDMIRKMTDNLVTVTNIPLGNISVRTFTAVTDNLLYLFCQTASGFVVYSLEGGTLRYNGFGTVGDEVLDIFGFQYCQFINDTLYLGGPGNVSGTTGLAALPLPCPTSELLNPTVEVDIGTQAAGGIIGVLWDNIRIPNATDYIALFSASAVFNTSWLLKQNTDGTASGETIMTIPPATPPGSYVIILGTKNNNVYMARSTPFTVV